MSENLTHDQLRQCCAWCRTFVKHAQRELIGVQNSYPKAANQLMILLAELVTKEIPHGH